MRAKFVNERLEFKEVSDPIHDMRIGKIEFHTLEDLLKYFQELGYEATLRYGGEVWIKNKYDVIFTIMGGENHFMMYAEKGGMKVTVYDINGEDVVDLVESIDDEWVEDNSNDENWFDENETDY